MFCLFPFFGKYSYRSLLQQHRGNSNFFFEVRSRPNHLAFAVSRFCTDVSVNDTLLVTIGRPICCGCPLKGGASLQRFDDVTGVAKTDILR